MRQRSSLTQSYASLYGDQNTKKLFIANKIVTVGAVRRPPAQMQPERKKKEKPFQVHYI